MKSASVKKMLYAFAAAAPIAAAQTPLNNRVVEITFPKGTPLGTGQLLQEDRKAKVQCNGILVLDGKKYPTPDFVQQTDVNQQRFEFRGDPGILALLPPNPVDSSKVLDQNTKDKMHNMLGTYFGTILKHHRDLHKSCLKREECPPMQAFDLCSAP